jgi:hypothetical protein
MPGRLGGILDKKYRRALESQSPQNLLVTTLGTGGGPPPDLPPGNQVFPERMPGRAAGAVDARTLQDGPLPILLGQDRLYADPGEVASYEWPNPRGLPRAVELRTLLATPLPELFGQDLFYGSGGQTPTPDMPLPLRLGRRAAPEPSPGSPGLLAPPPAGLPPGGVAAELGPQRAARRADQPGQPSLLLGPLAGQDALYGAPGQVPSYDWQLPVPPRSPRLLRGHAWWTSPTLVGQDALYGAPGQAAVYEWPVPTPPRRSNVWRGHAAWTTPILVGQDSVYAGPGQVAGYDWPVPGGRMRPEALRTWAVSLVVGTLAGQDVLYGAPGQVATASWPLLPAAKRREPGWTWWAALAAPATPTIVLDWPLVIPRPMSRVNRSREDGPLPRLLGQDILYAAPGEVAPYEWPVPNRPGAFRGNRDWLAWPLPELSGQDAFYAGPGQVPTAAWPLATQRRPRWVDEKVLLLGPLPDLIGQDVVYGAPGEVPGIAGPLVVPRRVSAPDWLAQAIQGALMAGPQTPPPGVESWPDRVWGRPPAQRPGSTAAVVLVLLGQDRVYAGPGQVPSYDLTIARVVRRSPAWEWAEPAALLSPAAPIAAVDWPVTRMRGAAVELRTIVDGPLVALLGQDRFFGAPGETTWAEWPVPRGRMAMRADIGDGRMAVLAQVAPTFAVDWPLRPAARRLVSEGWLQAGELVLPAPFIGPAWPERMAVRLRGVAADVAQPLTIVSTPFAAAVQDIRAARERLRPEAAAQRPLLQLLGQDVLYGAAGEVIPYAWPVPAGREPQRENRTWLVDVAGTGLYLVPERVPVYEWPVTRKVVTNRFVDWEQEPGRMVRLPLPIDLIVHARPLALIAAPRVLVLVTRMRPTILLLPARPAMLAARLRWYVLGVTRRRGR